MVRAGIYNRCSTEEEAQMNALGIQVSESREIVLSKGWTIATQYVESQSGTTSYKRTEYQRLLDDLEKDLFDVVVIKSIDRLTRSAKDWYIFLDKMTKNNKKLYIYIEHKFYTTDDSLLTGIKAILAEDFSRELSKKIKNAHRRRQEKKSGFNITVPIFGWDKVDKDVYVLNEEEANAYKLAFVMAQEGKGFYSIANVMYERGVRSKKGTRISEVQWRKMLYSPRAHGTMVLHTTEYDFETKQTKKVPESDWIIMENALPPIVSKEYQENVLKILRERTAQNNFINYTRNMTKTGLYDLSGKLICSECGRPYYRNQKNIQNKKIITWKCSTAMAQGRKTKEKGDGCNNPNVTEENVCKAIRDSCNQQYETLFGDQESITEEMMSLLYHVFWEERGKNRIEKLEKELKNLKKKKEILSYKLVDEVISDEDFIPLNRSLENKIKSIRTQIDDINGDKQEYIDYDKRLCEIKQALYDGVAEEAKTKVLVGLIEQIIVCPDGSLYMLPFH